MAKLYFFYGAMGSCKSANLITTAYNYLEQEQDIVDFENQDFVKLLKSQIDTRDGENVIKTRLGLSVPCETLEEFFEKFQNDNTTRNNIHDYKVIMVDECQFAKQEHIELLSDIVDFYDIPVLCYGLRADSNGKLFEGSKALLCMADEITEIKTMCWCGRKATYNARFDENGIIKNAKQIQIGGNDQYKALCRKHWKQGKLKGVTR